jgi:hypothetical protein
MARLALIPPDCQIPLALEPEDGAQTESVMRGEYRRLPISRRLTFEQAMADTALAICIRNLAEAKARRVGGSRRI